MTISRHTLITFSALLCLPVLSTAQDDQTTSAKGNQQQIEAQELRPSWINANVAMEERSAIDLGLANSYGHDSAVNNVNGVSSQFFSTQGTLGLTERTRTTSFSLRHDATILQFPGSGLDFQQYQWTTLNLVHTPSRRTTWGLNAANAYGADAARASSSLSLAAVSNTSIDNNSVLAGLITGNVLRQFVSGVVDHQASETMAYSLGANASFQNFLGAAASTQQYGVNGSVRKYLSEAFLVGVRADGVQQNYGHGNCTTASLLGFTTLQLTRSIQVDGSIGPAFGAAQCTGNYQYQALLSTQTVRGSRTYIGTSRKRGNGEIAGSLWETSVFGGMQVGNPRSFTVAVNGGYTSYHGGTPITVDNDVSGYFISGEVHRPIGRTAEWSFTIRQFQRSVAAVDLSRSIFFLTFTWHKEHGGRYGY